MKKNVYFKENDARLPRIFNAILEKSKQKEKDLLLKNKENTSVLIASVIWDCVHFQVIDYMISDNDTDSLADVFELISEWVDVTRYLKSWDKITDARTILLLGRISIDIYKELTHIVLGEL